MLKAKKPDFFHSPALAINPTYGGTLPIELPGNINSFLLKP
jgi:hypothetical protein